MGLLVVVSVNQYGARIACREGKFGDSFTINIIDVKSSTEFGMGHAVRAVQV